MKQATTQQMRQGDILIGEVAEIPADAKPRLHGDVILAHGEVTGHMHRVARADVAELFDHDRGTFVRVSSDTAVVHDEHGACPLVPGKAYLVSRQCEYTPAEIRNVAD